MKLLYGIVLGMILMFGTMTVFGQPREFHPRLVRAIEALREAKVYMEEAPHDFGGHKREAIRACDEAIRQLEFARAYHPRYRAPICENVFARRHTPTLDFNASLT